MARKQKRWGRIHINGTNAVTHLFQLLNFPAAGSATWKYQAVGGYWKPDLLRIYVAMELL